MSELTKYAISIGFGAIIVVLFASRRLDNLTVFPAGEEYQIARLLSASTLAGRRAYRRSLVYYSMFLLTLYTFFCIIEPIPDIFWNSTVSSFQYNNPTWPLGAALVVVGLLPATPIIEQIELALRGLAQRAADIPESFLASVTRLSQAPIDNLTAEGGKFEEDVLRAHRIRNILSLVGISSADSEYFANRYLLIGLYYHWTLAPQASSFWSAGTLSKFDSVENLIRSRVNQLRDDSDQLTASTLSSEYVSSIAKSIDVRDWSIHVNDDRIRSVSAYQDGEAVRKDLRDRWTRRNAEADVLAKQLIAVFVMLTANDYAGVNTSEVPRYLIDLAQATQAKPAYNAGALALFWGFIGAFGVTALFVFAARLVAGFSLSDAIKTGLSVGARNAINSLLSCGVALLVAIAVRYAKQVTRSYVEWTSAVATPVGQTLQIFAYSMIGAALVEICSYLLFQYLSGTLTPAMAFSRDNLVTWLPFLLILAAVPAIFAVTCLAILDLEVTGISTAGQRVTPDANRKSRPSAEHTAIFGAVFASVLAFVILAVNPIYELETRLFWSEWFPMAAFVSVALFVFVRQAEKVAL